MIRLIKIAGSLKLAFKKVKLFKRVLLTRLGDFPTNLAARKKAGFLSPPN